MSDIVSQATQLALQDLMTQAPQMEREVCHSTSVSKSTMCSPGVTSISLGSGSPPLLPLSVTYHQGTRSILHVCLVFVLTFHYRYVLMLDYATSNGLFAIDLLKILTYDLMTGTNCTCTWTYKHNHLFVYKQVHRISSTVDSYIL